jgi:hypothetical protein
MGKQRSLALYVVFFGALALILVVFGNDAVFAIVTGLMASVVFLVAQQIVANTAYRHYWAAPLVHRGEPYRMSMSYLVLVAHDDKVLLVASQRFDHFQPVGGVYKSFPDAVAELDRCGQEADLLIPQDDESRDDLRLVVRGRHVLRFLRWFDSGRNRECGPWREFHEELVSPGMLPAAKFGAAQFRYLGRHHHPVRRPEHTGRMREILVADIFELVPSKPQVDELARLQATDTPGVLWLSKAAARRRGAGETAGRVPAVADHTSWLLDHSALS